MRMALVGTNLIVIDVYPKEQTNMNDPPHEAITRPRLASYSNKRTTLRSISP